MQNIPLQTFLSLNSKQLFQAAVLHLRQVVSIILEVLLT